MKKVKIIFNIILFVLKTIVKKIKSLLKSSYSYSYFLSKNGSTIYSYIPSSNQVGKKVRIDTNVRILSGVKIGDYTVVNKDVLIESGVIGNFCSVAEGVSIGMKEHPLDYISTHPAAYYSMYGIVTKDRPMEQKKEPPIIGNDVWIARDATILRGVKIGNGAVIAGGTVVTKDVPPYAIVAGVPGKIIKYRLSEERINYLQDLKWWEEEEKAKKMFMNTN